MNAHANARAWHGDRKARTVKQQKTIEANKKALAVADKKVQVQLSKVSLTWLFQQGVPACQLSSAHKAGRSECSGECLREGH